MRSAAAAATALVGLLAVPAGATHRPPISGTYDVTLPLPYAVEGASHCTDGVEGASKHTKPLTLPDRGTLDVELSGFLGDWVLELFDAKGRMIAQAAVLEPTNTAPRRTVTYRKATPGMKVAIAVCNVTGAPPGRVRYTFTFR